MEYANNPLYEWSASTLFEILPSCEQMHKKIHARKKGIKIF